jgi:hypothetical protein
MTIPLYRATRDGVNTSEGGLLASGQDYKPPVNGKGELHPDDAHSIEIGDLAVADNRKPNDEGVLPDPEPDPKPKPAARGKQEA